MKTFLVTAAIVTVCLSVIELGGCGGIDTIKIQTTEVTTATTTATTTTTTLPTPGITSVYDATYSGVFTYEYQQRSSLDDQWTDSGTWTPASFTLTLTFKTVEITSEHVELNITRVTCSDPVFGAVNEVVPRQGSDTYAYLPVNLPTGPNNIAPAYMGINLKFPNFSLLQMPTLTRDGVAAPGALVVGAGGSPLANTTEPAIEGWTWLASTPSGVFMNPSSWGYYQHRFTSWNLTRISN